MNNMKESENRKSTWARCLSIAAILLCLLVCVLWAFEVMPHSVITPDTFIGTCVALLGVIVTVAVGSQIVNVMEVKSAQRKYEDELKVALEKIQRQQEQMEEEQHRNSLLHNCNLAKSMRDDKQCGRACYYYVCALYENLQLKTTLGNEASILSEFHKCLQQEDGVWNVPQKMCGELKNADVLMRQHANYHWIQTQYEPLRDDYFKKIGI